MSLTWDLSAIVDCETVCFETDATRTEEMRPVTRTIVVGTMHVGINQITRETASEFHARLRAFHTACGVPPIVEYSDRQPIPEHRHVTLAEIRAHLGLRTNATVMSGYLFARKVGERLLREAKNHTRQETSLDW